MYLTVSKGFFYNFLDKGFCEVVLIKAKLSGLTSYLDKKVYEARKASLIPLGFIHHKYNPVSKNDLHYLLVYARAEKLLMRIGGFVDVRGDNQALTFSSGEARCRFTQPI